ncbi:hypothetical protein ACTA71_010325 [Dictyostelium dimigraforme]
MILGILPPIFKNVRPTKNEQQQQKQQQKWQKRNTNNRTSTLIKETKTTKVITKYSMAKRNQASILVLEQLLFKCINNGVHQFQIKEIKGINQLYFRWPNKVKMLKQILITKEILSYDKSISN